MDPDRRKSNEPKPRRQAAARRERPAGTSSGGNGEKSPSILKNIILGIALVLAVVLVAEALLALGTRHNKEIAVPSFSSLSIDEARRVADSAKVKIDVTDSVYMPKLPRGVVFSQNPPAGSKVKKGRRILITINAVAQKMVKMPKLEGYSLRQAKTELASEGLEVGRLVYRSDMATNNVLEQLYNGRNIVPGKEIPAESEIDLVLGLNTDDSRTYVPDVVGYKYSVAKSMLIENSLNVGRRYYDKAVKNYGDSLDAVVYRQSPSRSENSSCTRGTEVDLYLSSDPDKIKDADGGR